MSKINWTPAQSDAIHARGGPLLVSAAAGSGKTEVLVQRIISIITDESSPTDIDRFLVVTFTNAAADEMKQRIGRRIEELLLGDPYNENLIRQQLLLGKAQISTVDSFCRSLSKEFFYALDIPADFRLADEEELKTIKSSAMNAVLDKLYESGDSDFLMVADIYSGSHDNISLQKCVNKICEFLNAKPFPDRWISDMTKLYEDSNDVMDSVWGRFLWESSLESMKVITEKCGRMLEICDSDPKLEKIYDLGITEREMINGLNTAFMSNSWDEVYNEFRKINFGRFPTLRKLGDSAAAKNEAKLCRDKYKEELLKTAEFFGSNSVMFTQEIESLRKITSGLFKLVKEYRSEYSRLKLERSVADFSDVEHWALSLLCSYGENGPELTDKAMEIADRFDYVMVDEYQDTNLIQDTIFKVVSGMDKRLFVVGDVKQSIYSFRQSTPEIFIGRRSMSQAYERNKPSFPSKINLDANFRSRSGVTDCVNFVFSNVMSERAGGVDYDDSEELKPLANYPEDSGTAAQFHLLTTHTDDGDECIEAEARYVASIIYKMMETDTVTNKDGTVRKPTLGDFCILLRNANRLSVIYSRELLRLGIPTVCEQGEGFLQQPEIRLMISLLKAIDNPARDVPVVAALISPLYGFTPDEIGEMRAMNPEKSIYEILLSLRESGNEKASYFLNSLDRLRSCGNNLRADELIGRVYSETLLPEIVLSGNDGEFRRRNLFLLTELAKKYEQNGFKGLGSFVSFLDRLDEDDNKLYASDRSDGTSANAVRLMTIHKSKGLEFPICIIGGIGVDYNTQETKDKIRLHSELGLGVNVVSPDRSYHYKGLIRKAVNKAKKNEQVSEELRVLYVAMTRARERLVMVASREDGEKALSSACGDLMFDGRIDPYSVMNSKGFLDIMLYSLLVSRDGGELREKCGYTGEWRRDDRSNWQIVLADTDKIESGTRAASYASSAAEEIDRGLVEQQLEMIRKKLSRRYKYEKECSIPVKVAASVLAEKQSKKHYGAVSRPSFMNEGGMTAAQRGTAMHAFAQYCDFEAARESIEEEKKRLVREGFLTESEAGTISSERVRTFLESELMEKLLTADNVEREYNFAVEIPAGMADPTLSPPDSEAKIVLQGAMDCLYEKDGVITIVDYKTDNVETGEELAEQYAPQLRLYKYAAEQIFGKKVERCVLYSFKLGREVEIEDI